MVEDTTIDPEVPAKPTCAPDEAFLCDPDVVLSSAVLDAALGGGPLPDDNGLGPDG